MNKLKDPCKTLLHENKCLGCNKLEIPSFEGDKECIYAKELWKESRE